jgi:hypothetical protein
MVPLCNQLLFVVICKDFVTCKIAITSNCNGTLQGKMGKGLKVASFFYSNERKVTQLL